MAFGGGSGKGPRSDINVTPLIDVVLVLLIVFMVLIPKQLTQMTIDVPPKDTSNQPTPPTADDQLVVQVGEDDAISINHEPVTKGDLPEKVRKLMEHRTKKLVFFDPDEKANYGLVAQVMDICRGSGVKTIGIMTKN